MAASIANYTIGKGIVTINSSDVGNCPKFEFQPQVTKLDHYSSRTGVKTRDKTVITEKKGVLTMTLDEWTIDNINNAVYGILTSGSSSILAASDTTVQVVFTMSNTVGNKFTWTFPSVIFTPNKAISLISDTWGEIELTGDVFADTLGSFGTVTAVTP